MSNSAGMLIRRCGSARRKNRGYQVPSAMQDELLTERPSASGEPRGASPCADRVHGKDAEGGRGDEQHRVTLVASAVGGAELPGEVLIAPWGAVASSNGDFVLDEESAALVLAAFEAHGTDIPLDYEHQSLGGAYASPTGQAPAAGWIKALRVASPRQCADGVAGLFARVQWTDAARERLIAREYRYLSPVVLVRQSDRRVVALHSVALTNKPAIIGARPIVNAELVPAGLPIAECGSELPSDLRGGGDGVDMAADGEALELLRHRLDLDADCTARW